MWEEENRVVMGVVVSEGRKLGLNGRVEEWVKGMMEWLREEGVGVRERM